MGNVRNTPCVGFDSNPTNAAEVRGDIPYSQQYYYRREFGDDLAIGVRRYIESGQRSLVWDWNKTGDTPKTLRLKLNCARSWIVHHPDNYPADIVAILKRSSFNKINGVLQLTQHLNHPDFTPNALKKGRSLAETAIIGDATDNPIIHPVVPIDESDPIVPQNITYHDPTTSIHATDTILPPAPDISPRPTMHNHLPDDGDLDTLIINIDAWASNAPTRDIFERRGILLCENALVTLKKHILTKPEIVGRAEKTVIMLVKL